MTTRRRTAAEIIAFHFCSDIADWRDSEYQHGKYSCAVFTSGDHYYAAPTAKQKLPGDWIWEQIAEHYGRAVYRSAGTITMKDA